MKLKTIFTLIGVMALTITMASPASFCNGAGASNSANYVSDLQNKQESVTSIKEDTVNIQKELLRKIDETGVVCSPGGQFSKLEVSGKELIELVPPSARIYLEACRMSGTLTPQADTKKKK
jgi:predicted methyltransferase